MITTKKYIECGEIIYEIGRYGSASIYLESVEVNPPVDGTVRFIGGEAFFLSHKFEKMPSGKWRELWTPAKFECRWHPCATHKANQSNEDRFYEQDRVSKIFG